MPRVSDWQTCPHVSARRCFECAGTGVRGAKLSGRKICRNCGGTGKVKTCVRPSERYSRCSWCPDADVTQDAVREQTKPGAARIDMTKAKQDIAAIIAPTLSEMLREDLLKQLGPELSALVGMGESIIHSTSSLDHPGGLRSERDQPYHGNPPLNNSAPSSDTSAPGLKRRYRVKCYGVWRDCESEDACVFVDELCDRFESTLTLPWTFNVEVISDGGLVLDRVDVRKEAGRRAFLL